MPIFWVLFTVSLFKGIIPIVAIGGVVAIDGVVVDGHAFDIAFLDASVNFDLFLLGFVAWDVCVGGWLVALDACVGGGLVSAFCNDQKTLLTKSFYILIMHWIKFKNIHEQRIGVSMTCITLHCG